MEFWADFSGGWGKHGAGFRFAGVCKHYPGPSLPWLVVACKAPDGTFWALQSWQRGLPDDGVAPTADQSAWELHLSHWSGSLPVLQITTDWVYGGRFDHLFGTFTYAGTGVYGFKSTPRGAPLDSWGRHLYLDAYNSPLGTGWQRDNSSLTHKPKGTFCYGFFPHAGHPAAKGTKYRATVEGPGVTPDIMWEGAAPGTYAPAADAEANTAEFAFRARTATSSSVASYVGNLARQRLRCHVAHVLILAGFRQVEGELDRATGSHLATRRYGLRSSIGIHRRGCKSNGLGGRRLRNCLFLGVGAVKQRESTSRESALAEAGGCGMKAFRFGVLVALASVVAALAAGGVSAASDVVGQLYVNDNTAGVNTVAGFDRHADGSLTADLRLAVRGRRRRHRTRRSRRRARCS